MIQTWWRSSIYTVGLFFQRCTWFLSRKNGISSSWVGLPVVPRRTSWAGTLRERTISCQLALQRGALQQIIRKLKWSLVSLRLSTEPPRATWGKSPALPVTTSQTPSQGPSDRTHWHVQRMNAMSVIINTILRSHHMGEYYFHSVSETCSQSANSRGRNSVHRVGMGRGVDNSGD